MKDICQGNKKGVLLFVVFVLFFSSTSFAQDPNEPGFFTGAILNAWEWVCQQVWEGIETFLDFFLNAIPDNWYPKIEPIGLYISLANTWIPIDIALGLLAAYYMFVMMFCVFKLILKLIPGIG